MLGGPAEELWAIQQEARPTTEKQDGSTQITSWPNEGETSDSKVFLEIQCYKRACHGVCFSAGLVSFLKLFYIS